MTREEAIKILKFQRGYFCDFKGCQEQQAFTMAIKALKQEPCEDAISRQAVDKLSKELVHTTRDKADFLCNFWEGLQKLPPVTPQPCGDAISRKDTCNAIIKRLGIKDETFLLESERAIYQQILAMPPVTPWPEIGHWIKHDTGHSIYYDCSLCACIAPCTETADTLLWKLSNYCPDCGAKMEVEE